MCDQEAYKTLTESEHFIRHTMRVEQGCAVARRGRQLGETGLNEVMRNARHALELESSNVTEECHHMLACAAIGDISEAAGRL